MIYEFMSPDGQIHEVEGEGTREEALAQLQKSLAAPMPESPSGFAQGVMDPLYGASQMLENALPDAVTSKVNQFNDWLVDQGLPLERMGEGGVDAQLQRREDAYSQAREAAGDTGTDWGRIGGNIAGTTIPGAGLAGPAAGLGTRLAMGAGGGAAGAAVMPSEGGEGYWADKLKQALAGAALGGIGTGATAGIGRVFSPQTDDAVMAMQEAGVPLTAGQALGGGFKKAEEASRSIPGMGDFVTKAHERGINAFHREAINRSLRPIGQELPDGIDSGHEAIKYAKSKLSETYDSILPQMRGELDDQMLDELGGLESLVRSIPEEQQTLFERIIDNEITDRFTEYGMASGETLQDINSKLGTIARGYGKSQDYDVRQLGMAVREAQDIIRNMISRHNPDHADMLARVNEGYANYKVLNKAGSMVGAEEGVFTPNQLYSAAKAKDFSKDKDKFGTGDALMQDFAKAGKSTVAQKLPTSGTAERAMLGAGTLGASGMISPTAALTQVGGILGSLPLPQRAMVGAITKRPDWARRLGGLLGDYSVLPGVGFGTLGQ